MKLEELQTKGLPPGPNGHEIRQAIGRPLDFIAFYQWLHQKYGDIASFDSMGRKYCALFHPQLAHELFVTKESSFAKEPILGDRFIVQGPTALSSDSDLHRQLRRSIRPSLGKDALKYYAPAVLAEILKMQEGLQDGDTFNLSPVIHQLMLNIMAATFLGREVENAPAAIDDLLRVQHALLSMGNETGHSAFDPGHRQKVLHTMDSLMDRAIDQVLQNGQCNTIIAHLLRAMDENLLGSTREIKDESYAMILAGYGPTVHSILWCFCHLDQTPRVRALLEEEVKRVLNGRPLAPEDYPKFTYAQAVFNESLRLTPPVYAISREAMEDTELGGHFIPKGTIVLAVWWVFQRNEKYFSQPLEFKPERWHKKAASKGYPYAYLPFGGGVHNCVGAGFAKMIAVFVLVSMTRHWRVRRTDQSPPEATTTVAFYLLRKGLPIVLEQK